MPRRSTALTLTLALALAASLLALSAEALVIGGGPSSSSSSSCPSPPQAARRPCRGLPDAEASGVPEAVHRPRPSRRGVLRSASAASAAALGGWALRPGGARADLEGVVTPTISDVPATRVPGEGETVMYKTGSGLKYIDIVEGTGPTPRYGQLLSISYKGYVKLPPIKGVEQKAELFDTDVAFLLKHGNGKVVPGLDEGLHTMRAGGRRKLLLPAKLGYVQDGVGPIPAGPLERYKLNKLLNRMVEVKAGNLVFDVTLKSMMDDEADAGYYDDRSISPEDFDQLKENIQRKGMDARAAQATQV